MLDTREPGLRFAHTMTWKGPHLSVKLVAQVYQTEGKLVKTAMDELEKRFERLPGLEKWFVRIETLSA